MNEIHIRPLGPADLDAAALLLGTMNAGTPVPLLRVRLQAVLTDHPHYQLAGAFAGDRLTGVCGAWTATRIWCGRYLEIDNLVVDPELRSSGIGGKLIGHFEQIARENDCKILVLDSYTSNHASHRLYHRLGFEIWGFHFIKPIGDRAGGDHA